MNSETDGIDHVNVYSKGKTILGRFLSNFTPCRIPLPEGTFYSVEGYWYYLNTDPDNPRRDELKKTTGWRAKELGRELKAKDWNDDPLFQAKIKFAVFQKILSEPKFFNELKHLEIPLVHYYEYGGKVIEPKEGKWLIDFLNGFRIRS